MLKAERVAELLRQGEKLETRDPLVITPTPDLKTLEESGAASVNIRLGTWFLTLRQARMTHLAIDEEKPASQFSKTQYVPFGTDYYLHPNSFVLGTTLEWLRLPSNIAAYVIGRSSWGRRGLIIATATGVHPGFKGCLTLELTNIGEIPIAIKPGIEICQLFFHDLAESGSSHIDKSSFIGRRRPVVGRISFDMMARKLANAYKIKAANTTPPPKP